MAEFNNDIHLSQTDDEQIEQMQKAINYLFDKIEKLEKKINKQRNKKRRE